LNTRVNTKLTFHKFIILIKADRFPMLDAFRGCGLLTHAHTSKK